MSACNLARSASQTVPAPLASLSCLFKKKQKNKKKTPHLSGAMTTHCHVSLFKKGKTWIISSFML